MALYAVGDVQGCYRALRKLLDKIDFQPPRDHLWLTGDLVNRGPQSLEVLRFVRDLGDAATTVLGNHDLHLLAAAADVAPLRSKDTFGDILQAPDRDALIHWLRMRPFCVHQQQADRLLVHASVHPAWDVATILNWARDLEDILRGPEWRPFLENMYGNEPKLLENAKNSYEMNRFVTNVFTRVRYVKSSGEIDLEQKGVPGSQDQGFLPWFKHQRKSKDTIIIFGHWSALGEYMGHNVIGLDTGCVWGGALTAVQLDTAPPRFYRIRCQPHQTLKMNVG